jgi:hypothetical protein
MSLLLLPTIRASRKRFLPETFAFAAASGATDLQPLDNLFRYVLGAGLWSNFRIYPQKSAQNAGSGSTVYGAGALTANNMTLVGSPTWGTDGIVYNGTTQCGRIVDFLGTATLTVFAAVTQASADPADIEHIISQFSSSDNKRSITLQQAGTVAGGPYRLVRSSNGDGGSQDVFASAGSLGSTSARTIVGQWIAGGGRALWFNNSSISVSLSVGSAQTQKFNSDADIGFAATINVGTPASFAALTGKAAAFLEGVTLTTTQRETITNLINAL